MLSQRRERDHMTAVTRMASTTTPSGEATALAEGPRDAGAIDRELPRIVQGQPDETPRSGQQGVDFGPDPAALDEATEVSLWFG